MDNRSKPKKRKIGLAPGSIIFTGKRKVEKIQIHYMEYDAARFREELKDNQKIQSFYQPNKDVVQWYDIRGIHDELLIEEFGKIFNIHSLILEDVVDVHQRPKFDEYPEGNLILLHALNIENDSITKEMISIYLGDGFVITFQESDSDVFSSVRTRINTGKTRIRQRGADYLAFALMDCVVDNYFNVLDKISERINEIEYRITETTDNDIKQDLLKMKQLSIRMRKSVLPTREAIAKFSRTEHPLVQQNTFPYIRDAFDNIIQIMDSLETNRDTIIGLQDLYVTEISFKMNKVMQFLTIVTTIFVPLSFFAGVYGMNFEYMPELKYRYGYFFLWGFMALISLLLLYIFRKKDWL